MIVLLTLFKLNVKNESIKKFIYKIYSFVISLAFVNMELIINDLDLDKPLPSVIAIKSAENHLYRN
jgi:hypothetical protein